MGMTCLEEAEWHQAAASSLMLLEQGQPARHALHALPGPIGREEGYETPPQSATSPATTSPSMARFSAPRPESRISCSTLWQAMYPSQGLKRLTRSVPWWYRPALIPAVTSDSGL